MKKNIFFTCGFFEKIWQCLTLCSSQSKRLTIARCKIKWLIQIRFYVHEISENIWLRWVFFWNNRYLWKKIESPKYLRKKPNTLNYPWKKLNTLKPNGLAISFSFCFNLPICFIAIDINKKTYCYINQKNLIVIWTSLLYMTSKRLCFHCAN